MRTAGCKRCGYLVSTRTPPTVWRAFCFGAAGDDPPGPLPIAPDRPRLGPDPFAALPPGAGEVGSGDARPLPLSAVGDGASAGCVNDGSASSSKSSSDASISREIEIEIAIRKQACCDVLRRRGHFKKSSEVSEFGA